MNRVSILDYSALGVVSWRLKPYHNLHYVVNAREHDCIENIFERVVERTKILNGKKFTDLHIYAHGRGIYIEDELAQMSHKIRGFGMKLGGGKLDLSNLYLANVLKDHFEQIVLYNCGVAQTAPGYEGTTGDGQRFCGEIAIRTNTEVIASSEVQWYKVVDGVIDNGAWEGTVYKFSPIDGSSSIVYK